jgi:chromate transporter, chromate ion transporter (CHR) family
MSHVPRASAAAGPGSAWEVLAAFLKLGVSSFGGPIAHLGYFQREFVERRRWLDGEHFAQLLALCQFLPGPASSQLGFSIGLLRAGGWGGLAAFVGFTLPSALLMFAFAVLSARLSGALGQAAIHGLKLVAVAVVAHGLLGMVRRLTPDVPRLLLAALAALLIAIGGNAWMQLLVVALGAALGPWLCRTVVARPGKHLALRHGRRGAIALLIVFAVLLLLSLAPWPGAPRWAQATAGFYRAGALVFGGGHVVLPLLKQTVVDPGWLDGNSFLAGYGAAQAVPGPMFSLAAFLGERIGVGQSGALGATVCLLAIFLPGLLLVSAALPFWQALAARDDAARVLAGVNAAVVGLLAAALYNPVWISAVRRPLDVVIALSAFALLAWARWPALAIAGWCVTASLLTVLF